MDASSPHPHRPLWLAVAFPLLGLAVHTRAQPRAATPRPLALVRDGRVLACNAEAQAAGVAPGQRTAGAVALCPPLRFLEGLPAQEAALLRQLAEACIAVTPTVVLAPPHTLLLEIGGCLQLFRGQAGLLKALRRALKPVGVAYELAQAPTPKAALALVASAQAAASLQVMAAPARDSAHVNNTATHVEAMPDQLCLEPRLPEEPLARISPPASPRESLGTRHRHAVSPSAPAANTAAPTPSYTLRDYLPLLREVPVTALPWDDALQQKLRALHLHTLGDLLALPRAALSKRLGVAVTRYLAQLEGALPDPQTPITVAEDFEATLFFLDGISHVEGLRFPMKRLLDDLCRFLRRRQLACARFTWRFAHQDKSRQQLVIASHRGEPQAARFLQLTELQLEHFRISAPVEALILQAREFQAQGDTRLALLPDPGEEDSKAMELLDRLRARLGADACQPLVSRETWRPEEEQGFEGERGKVQRGGVKAYPHPGPLPEGEGTQRAVAKRGRTTEIQRREGAKRGVGSAGSGGMLIDGQPGPRFLPADRGAGVGAGFTASPVDLPSSHSGPVDEAIASAASLDSATVVDSATATDSGASLDPVAAADSAASLDSVASSGSVETADSVATANAVDTAESEAPLSERTRLRPFWLWTQPQPLRLVDGRLWWQGALTLLTRPERIVLPWWEDGETRDYYLARHDNGAHYWIYFAREQQQWFCHGLFG